MVDSSLPRRAQKTFHQAHCDGHPDDADDDRSEEEYDEDGRENDHDDELTGFTKF